MAGFLPPYPPWVSAAEVAAIYQRDAFGIRIGSILMRLAGALYLPFTSAIAAQMRRIGHRKIVAQPAHLHEDHARSASNAGPFTRR